MKIRQADYIRLETLLKTFRQDYHIKPHADYPNMTQTRYVWDIFHACMDSCQNARKVEDYLFLRSLWDYLNDTHIETALKRILL